MPYNDHGDAKMPDYKEMYFTMLAASEKAIRIIIEAQRECEDMYINADDDDEDQDEDEDES